MEPRAPQTVGALLRRYRTAAGLTQEALAARSGVSVYSISNLEREVGHTPRKDTLALLADALELPPDRRGALEEMARRPRLQVTPDSLSARHERGHEYDRDPRSVPIPPTPLVGRDTELAAMGALLRERRVRLITLCGSPGVGKTRLALELAHHHADDFADGIAWVHLTPLADPQRVSGAIAQALGVRQQGAEPVEALLKIALQGKDLLLLLDNFEHLLPAAPLVAELLAVCDTVRIVVTSRAPLHLRGEQAFPLSPLPIPDPAAPPTPETLALIPSVALFVARAQAVLPSFALTAANARETAAICRRLDGLPLALELAAGRLTVLSPQTLLDLLDRRLLVLTGGALDLAAHQHTLRDTLAWSYDLLAADEQALFRRLAVFDGGTSLAAVASVCYGVRETSAELLDTLCVLLDHHLLMRLDEKAVASRGEPRYGMLETIQEYALEQLRLHDETAVTEHAHALYYLALAEAAEPKLRGPEQVEWLALLDVEYDNLRAALRWLLRHREVPFAVRLAAALSRFWMVRGYLSEGRGWFDELLVVVEDDGPSYPDPTFHFAFAQALNGAGALAHLQGDYARATELYGESLNLRRLLGNSSYIASTLRNLGLLAHAQGEVERAVALWRECLDVLGEDGDARLAGLVLNDLGLYYRRHGTYVLARELFSASLGRLRTVGDLRGVAQALGNLGELAYGQGDLAEAAILLDEALDYFQTLGDKQFVALSLCFLGNVARLQGDLPRARQLIGEGVVMLRAVGDREGISTALVSLGHVERVEGISSQATVHMREALRLSLTLTDRRGAILCVEGLASVAAAERRESDSVRLFASTAALREALGAPRPPAEHAEYDRLIAQARAALGEAGFAVAWEAGERFSFEEAIAEALGEGKVVPAPRQNHSRHLPA